MQAMESQFVECLVAGPSHYKAFEEYLYMEGEQVLGKETLQMQSQLEAA